MDINELTRIGSDIQGASNFVREQTEKIGKCKKEIDSLVKKIKTETQKLHLNNALEEKKAITSNVEKLNETLSSLKKEKRDTEKLVIKVNHYIDGCRIKQRVLQLDEQTLEIANEMLKNLRRKELPETTPAQRKALDAMNSHLLILKRQSSIEYKELVDTYNRDYADKADNTSAKENKVEREDTFQTRMAEEQAIREELGLTNVGQKERKETIKLLLKNPENFFDRIREICNSDPTHIARLQQELLDGETVTRTEKNIKPTNTKRGKKKTSKGAKHPSASASAASAPSLKKAETKQQILNKLYQEGPIAEGFVKLHKSMKIWQQKNVESKIREGEKYSGLDEAELEKQFLGHFIGMHTERLFNNKEFKNDFIRGSEGEFIMLCSATLKNGEEIHGKISFLINDKNEIFHRMFFKANLEESLESFLLKKAEGNDPSLESEGAGGGGSGGGGGGGAAAEKREPERVIGKFKVKMDEESGSITYTLTGNPLVASYMIHSFNRRT